MRFFSVNEYGCEEITSFAINFSGSNHRGRRDSPQPLGRTGMRRFARRLFRGRVARPGLVVGRYQPLADGDADAPAPPDHASLLQSLQKTKRSGLKSSSPLVFGFPEDGAGSVPQDRPFAPGRIYLISAFA